MLIPELAREEFVAKGGNLYKPNVLQDVSHKMWEGKFFNELLMLTDRAWRCGGIL